MVLYNWLNKRRLEAAREEGYREGRLLGLQEVLEEERRWLQEAFELLSEEYRRLQEWYANLPPEIKDQLPPPF
jgi:hypothetical protein